MATAISKQYAVVKDKTPVYKEAKKGTVLKKVDKTKKDSYVTATKKSGSYVFIGTYGGWVNVANLKAKASSSKKLSKEEAAAKKDLAKVREKIGKIEGAAFKSALIKMMNSTKKAKEVSLTASTRMFGMPHRFNRYADMPIGEKAQLGRKYTETFAVEAPILSICPGRPNFMDGNRSQSERKGILGSFFETIGGNRDAVSVAVNKLIGNNDTKYFTFYADFQSYINHVNLMCRAASVYLGIDRVKFNGKGEKKEVQYAYFDWQYYRFDLAQKRNMTKKDKETKGKSIFKTFFKAPIETIKNIGQEIKTAFKETNNYTQFYIDPSSSYQESASNTVGDSWLESKIGVADDSIKELMFLSNAIGLGKVTNVGAQSAADMQKVFDSFSPNNPLKRVLSGATTVLSGATLYYPKMYKSSEFSRSYNVNINLTSPYGDKESCYLNVIVPLCHLMALVLPKQNSANSYAAPFLVRASCKGLFHIEMGIVESLTIEKVQSSYTYFGIPTEVKVSMVIKDIYPAMMMTDVFSIFKFFENDTFRQWLGTLAGVDLTQRLDGGKYEVMFSTLVTGTFNDVTDNIGMWLRNKVNNTDKFIRGGNI